MMKYKNGERIKVLCNLNLNNESLQGSIVTILHSINHRNTYYFKGYDDDGWRKDYIEDEQHFTKARIDSWKNELEETK